MLRITSFAFIIALITAGAVQAGPVQLSDTQLDRVTAGAKPFDAVSKGGGNGAFETVNNGRAVSNGTVRFWMDGTINNFKSQAYLHANENSVVGAGCNGRCTRIRNPNDI